MAGEWMAGSLTLMVGEVVGVLPLPSILSLMVAFLALLRVLYHYWRISPRARKARASVSAQVHAEVESNAQAPARNVPARLPMPRISMSDLEPSALEMNGEERRASALEGEVGRVVERAAAAAGAEPRAFSRKTSSEFTLEARDFKEMVYIPAGEFWMGSDDKDENEKPMHKVYVDAYYIDKYPVTNAEFLRFAEQSGYGTEAEESGKGWIWQSEWREIPGACWRHPTGPGSSIEDRLDHPVVLVSWNDARAYCRWAGKRLPTEAEWEKSARGTDGRKWPWGNEWDPSRLNSGERGHSTTTPVGSYGSGVSPTGVYDMAGDVWEWVDEWYKPYPGSPCKDEDFGEKYRILRGGSWDSFGHNARCANRTRNLARACVNVNGFRCAMSAHKITVPPIDRQYDIHVPSKRILVGPVPEQIDLAFKRLRARSVSGVFDREVRASQVIEMGRSDIETMLGRDPFLFRNGRKAFSIEEIAQECLVDAEAGKYHLRSGHLGQYLKFIGWQNYLQPENIARAYYPTRDLPYYLGLVLEYSRHFALGLELLAPSEEVLDAIVVNRKLSSLLIRKAEVIVHPSDYSEMIYIPEGEFLMGASQSQIEEALKLAQDRHPRAVASWFADESPMFKGRTEAYLVDKFPVTNEQFEKFVAAEEYVPKSDWRRCFTPGRENHPVVMVSWTDASEYARWADKRLPSEAEWEKAARGVDGRKYSWGNKWDPARLNSLEKGPHTTTSVGHYVEGASPYGVMDTLGNVWEWTADTYKPYPGSNFNSDKFGDKYRVFRGGSWNNYQYNNRCSNRHREDADYTCMSHGFRCARSVTASDIRRR